MTSLGLERKLAMDRTECLKALRSAQSALQDALEAVEENEPQAVLEALEQVVEQSNRAIVGIARSVLPQV